MCANTMLKFTNSSAYYSTSERGPFSLLESSFFLYNGRSSSSCSLPFIASLICQPRPCSFSFFELLHVQAASSEQQLLQIRFESRARWEPCTARPSRWATFPMLRECKWGRCDRGNCHSRRQRYFWQEPPRRKIQNHEFSCNQELKQIVIGSQAAQHQSTAVSYRHPPIKSDDVPDKLDELCTSGFEAWYYSAMHVVSSSPSPKPATLVEPYNFEVVKVESNRKDVSKVFIDKGVTRERINIRPLDQQRWKREEAWLTIFEVEKVKNALYKIWKIITMRMCFKKWTWSSSTGI